MNEQQPAPDRRNHFIFVLVTLLYWAALYVYVPVLTPYLESIGTSYSMIGIVLGSYGFIQILLRLPLGIASDRLKRRKPYILLGMISITLSCVCFAWGEQIGWPLAGRIVSGIGASTWSAFTVMYAGMYRRDQMSSAMGAISLLIVAGQLAGMSISGFLVEWKGWNATFWTGTILGLAGTLLALLLRETHQPADRAPMQLKDLAPVMRDTMLWKVSTLSILAHSVLFITMFGFTPSYALVLGATEKDLTLLVLAFMIPHALSSFCSGRYWAPRVGEWNLIVSGFVVSAALSASTVLVDDFGWLLLTQAFNGFFQGLHFPLLLGLSIANISESKRATAMGFYQAVYAVGMFAGPFIAGALNEWAGLAGGFYFAGGIGIAAAVLTAYWRRNSPASARQQKKPHPVR
ncbi:MFS transporter [Paenibacillus sp. GD4]|uniref:MFS transporter n=1 Tax=Paenibacillus sp. GD4 TaxID=3068890 RepID=UPI0027967D35|nr:MFS transporter [Paenibacillus sp. GD4]MDQ1909110.1 MFS transporter [Paenibacillus sp. GD4]